MPIISPTALDWRNQAYVQQRYVWVESTYEAVSGSLEFDVSRGPIQLCWHQVPVERPQIDKVSTLAGAYCLLIEPSLLSSFTYPLVLYVGETGNIRIRFRSYVERREKTLASKASYVPGTEHYDPILFRRYPSLQFRYCEFDCSTVERRLIETQLIGVLDPPFNGQKKPRPIGNPLIPKSVSGQLGTPRAMRGGSL